MAKSAAFGVIHVATSFGVGYALTGSLAVAGLMTVVEPVCNTVAHYFFDRWWTARERRAETCGVSEASVESPIPAT